MSADQLDQHFIFNALNTITNVVEKDPAFGKELLLDFSDYLRGTFCQIRGQEFTTLEREMEMISGYLSLQRARFPDRLEFSITVSEHGKCRIPSGSIFERVEKRVKGALKEKNGRIDFSLGISVDSVRVGVELGENGEDYCWEIMIFQEI